MKRQITSEFKDAVHMIQTENNRILLYFDGLSWDELVLENVEDSIKKSALSIRRAVKEVLVKQSWPPSISELEAVNIPAFLDL